MDQIELIVLTTFRRKVVDGGRCGTEPLDTTLRRRWDRSDPPGLWEDSDRVDGENLGILPLFLLPLLSRLYVQTLVVRSHPLRLRRIGSVWVGGTPGVTRV